MSQITKCRKCGTSIGMGEKKCSWCGTRVRGKVSILLRRVLIGIVVIVVTVGLIGIVAPRKSILGFENGRLTLRHTVDFPSIGAAKSENFKVKFIKGEVGEDSTFLVTYKLTNKHKEAIATFLSLSIDAYQDGIELNGDFLDDISSFNKVQGGATVELTRKYKLVARNSRGN